MTPDDQDLLAEVARDLGIAAGPREWNCPTAEQVVDIRQIEPPRRRPPTPGFDRTSLVWLVRQLQSNGEVPPVGLKRLSGSPYDYAVYDGYHRYWISLALGLQTLPARFVEPVDLG